ncbi:hypothetical protein [Nostoc sp. DSM 114161]
MSFVICPLLQSLSGGNLSSDFAVYHFSFVIDRFLLLITNQ